MAAASVVRDDAVTRAAEAVARKVQAAQVITHRDLSRALGPSLLIHLADALDRLEAAGMLAQSGEVGQQGPDAGRPTSGRERRDHP